MWSSFLTFLSLPCHLYAYLVITPKVVARTGQNSPTHPPRQVVYSSEGGVWALTCPPLGNRIWSPGILKRSFNGLSCSLATMWAWELGFAVIPYRTSYHIMSYLLLFDGVHPSLGPAWWHIQYLGGYLWYAVRPLSYYYVLSHSLICNFTMPGDQITCPHASSSNAPKLD